MEKIRIYEAYNLKTCPIYCTALPKMIAKRDWYQVAWISHLAQGLPCAGLVSIPLLNPDSLDPSTFSRHSTKSKHARTVFKLLKGLE